MAPTTVQCVHKPECLVLRLQLLLFRVALFQLARLWSRCSLAGESLRVFPAFDDPLPIHQLQSVMYEVAIFFGLLLFSYFIYSRYFYAPYQVWRRYGIKGPTPVPFFGNYREESKLGVMKFFAHLQDKYGSVVGFYVGRKPYIMVTDLDMLKQILVKDFNNFIDRTHFPDIIPSRPRGLVQSTGETWKGYRHILSPTFSSAKMKMMLPLMKKSIDSLVEVFGNKVKANESFEFFKVYGAFTMETILATAFGRAVNVQGGESDELTKAANIIFRSLDEGSATNLHLLIVLSSNFPWLVPLLRMIFAHTERIVTWNLLHEIALDLVKARRKAGNLEKYKDLLQLMIDATGETEECEEIPSKAESESECPTDQSKKKPSGLRERKLTDEEVVGQAVTFLLGGYETTANTLAYTSYLLALNPNIQEKLQSEIDSYFEEKPADSLYEAAQAITYLDNVIQESLRLYSPGVKLHRECNKTTTINGVTIPEGAIVEVPIVLLHRNPLYWSEPDKFNPDRFTPEERAKRPQLAHLPFGFGPRNCIGMRFALLEAKIALIELLKRYTFVRTPDTEVPLQTVAGALMSPKNGIYLKVVNR